MNDEIRFFIGVPELARRIHKTRQVVHYRASTNQLYVRAYPLRTGRQITYIFDEDEVNRVLAEKQELWKDWRYRENNDAR